MVSILLRGERGCFGGRKWRFVNLAMTVCLLGLKVLFVFFLQIRVQLNEKIKTKTDQPPKEQNKFSKKIKHKKNQKAL
jgi:hypothetical protein